MWNQVKYIKRDGSVLEFHNYKMTKKGKLFKEENGKTIPVPIFQNHQGKDIFIYNGTPYRLERTIASTLDFDNYSSENCHVKQEKWTNEGRRGITYSKERNKKISQKLKGKKQSSSTCEKKRKRKMKPVALYKGDEAIRTFNSAREAADFLNVSPSMITLVCQGKRDNINGYKLKYL